MNEPETEKFICDRIKALAEKIVKEDIPYTAPEAAGLLEEKVLRRLWSAFELGEIRGGTR